ncbi:ATP-binding protein [Adlercreutzia sp. ZJ242]|uniref:ATP-binding protein n=1 Tax=Adlercreutzia sp. ZJ242 TaxID=2709409 RepID=UPI0013EA0042|nr:ATP-binding protein [Adlercreutzia sp. ZJ242]
MNSIDATIRMLLDDFRQTILPSVSREIISRDLSLGKITPPKVGGTAKAVVGMRRSGKTFRLYQEILRIVDSGVDLGRICYLNFDDDRLRPYAGDLISRTLEIFFEDNPDARSKGAYVFFDEIQDVEGWGITLRRILDTEKVSLYVTGSSSRLLAEDIATEFRGRSIAYELLPFSFREYLRALGLEPQSARELSNKETASRLSGMLKRYLVEGGFPAALGLDDAERVQLLQSYVQLTVARDVVERSRLSNAAYARNLARTAVTSSARDVSISRLDNKGKARGYTPGRAKIAEILDAFEDAHLVYQAYDFSYSAQKIRLGGLKLYASDPGMYWSIIPASNDGLSFALETAVYLELRRRRKAGRLGDVAMVKLPSGKEIDFIEGDALAESAYQLVQVSCSMEDAPTRKREVSALEEGMAQFGCGEGVIVTLNEESEISAKAGTIRVIPAWKWLLQES